MDWKDNLDNKEDPDEFKLERTNQTKVRDFFITEVKKKEEEWGIWIEASGFW